jgi:hypothetical protein
MDAKLMMALTATRGDTATGGEGDWTEYMKAFGGRLYRPDVSIDEEPPQSQEKPQPPTKTPAPPRHEPQSKPALTTAAPAGKPSITNPLFESSQPKRK